MGRHYYGDIDGKFWFAIQSSNDGDFFGGNSYEPSVLEYEFDRDDLPEVEAGLAKCRNALGEYLGILDGLDPNQYYSEEDLSQLLDIEADQLTEILTWYARFILGRKIHRCLQDKGVCYFSAEL